jgi:hypothetical protein
MCQGADVCVCVRVSKETYYKAKETYDKAKKAYLYGKRDLLILAYLKYAYV